MTTYLIHSEISDEGMFRAFAYEPQKNGALSLHDITEADDELVALNALVESLPRTATIVARCKWHVDGARKYGKFFGYVPEFLTVADAAMCIRNQA